MQEYTLQGYSWNTCPSETRQSINQCIDSIKGVIGNNLIGIYLHGSLAMGGFNPYRSDVDILVITRDPTPVEAKKQLTELFLNTSNHPYPLELSIMNQSQLKNNHPYPYDYHYSEYWRVQYEKELSNDANEFFHDEEKRDPDLAAHLTITWNRGITLFGEPIADIFPIIKRTEYIAAIAFDYNDCLENIDVNPVYCTLNLVRVYWYLKEGIICSKLEAGIWALSSLPEEMHRTIQGALGNYTSRDSNYKFDKDELACIRDFIQEKVNDLIKT